MQKDPSASGSWPRLLALFTFAGFIETIFWGQVAAFTPLYLPRFGIAPPDIVVWTGYIASLSTLVGIPFLPLWGALADRYARKPIIIRSFVAHLVAGILAVLAGNVWMFVLARSVMSLALGNSGLMMTTLSERTPRERMGFAFSVMNTAPPVGAFLGPLLGGPIVDHWGVPALLAIDVGLMAIVIAALWVGYHDDFHGTDRGPLLHMAAESVQIITRSPRLRALFPALFLLFAGWMLAYAYLPVATTALYSGDNPGTAIGAVMGAGGLLSVVLGPAVGALADRQGHWRTLFWGAAVATLLWPLPALAPNLIVFGAVWAVVNSIVSAVFSLSFTVLSNSTTPEVRGRVMSFSYLPVNIGGMVGPAIGSVITRTSVFTIFPAAAVLTLAGIGLLAIAARQAVAPAPGPALA